MQHQIVTCTQCGHSIRDGARFCSGCGVSLATLRAGTTIAASAGAVAPTDLSAAGVTTASLAQGLYAPGTTLGPSGRYRVERVLGQGGFGEAYLAVDTQLERYCVVKRMTANPAWSASDQQRVFQNFQREARLLVALNAPGHPNIPEIYEYLPESQCLVMKHIASHSLAQLQQQRGGRLSEEEALRYVRDACAALVYMHSRAPEPVLHRDIKPANILLDDEGRVWLIDFGLSKALPAQLSPASALDTQSSGTIGYTPPEQWRGQAAPRSDVYALAATLHTLLTGHRASGTDLAAVIYGQKELLPPARALNPEVRPEVERLIQRAMAFDIADRPSAAELLAELDALLAQPDLPSPPQPTPPPEVPGFVGRAAELAYFQQKLAQEHLAVIAGFSGMGKTALAATLARQVAPPDKVFWHAFHKDEGIDAIVWALAGFLATNGQAELWRMLQGARQSGGQPPPPAALFDYLVQTIRGRGYLLCLDDLQFVEDDPLLDQLVARVRAEVRSGQVSLIVTSRRVPEFVQEIAFEPLAGLSAADSRGLLAARELALADDVIDSLVRTTGGNAQLLLLSADALRRAKNPARLVANLLETEHIERFLLKEVDANLSDEERAVMHAAAALLAYPASRDGIAAMLDAGDSGALLQRDAYAMYETGLGELLKRLPAAHERYPDALLYQQRLLENIAQARRFGDTETRRAERAEVTDRLNELAQATIGRSFGELCGSVASTPRLEQGTEVRNLRKVLSELAGRHLLIVTEGEDGRTYQQHAIVQAFYYEALGRLERQLLHRRAAAYYEEAEPDALRAATHYERAGEYNRAADLATADVWAIVNAGQARALRHVLKQFTARQLDVERWIAVLMARGQVYRLMRESQLSQESYEEAFALLGSLPDTPLVQERKAHVCCDIGELVSYSSPQEALKWLRRGLDELAGGSPQEEAILQLTIGSVMFNIGDYAAASNALAHSLRLLPDDASQWRGDGLLNLGNVYLYQGDLQQAKDHYLQALGIYQQSYNYWRMVTGSLNLGLVMGATGDWTGAALEYRKALDLAERLGSITDQAILELALGILHTHLGEDEAAIVYLSQCLALARNHNLKDQVIAANCVVADLRIRTGAWRDAESVLSEVEQLALEIDAKHQLQEIYRLWAQVRLASGAKQAALDCAERSVELARDLGMELEVGMGLRVLGQTLLANGQSEPALNAFEQSLSVLDGNDPYQAARTKVQWGHALMSGMDRNRGTSLLREARAAFVALGAKRDLTEVEVILQTTET